MFAKTSTPNTSRIAFLFALLLLFALSTAALAAPLTNGDFGTAPDCHLNGWSTTGNVTTMPGSSSIGWNAGTDCLAKVHAALGGLYIYNASSTLNQSFEVPANTGAGSQTITFNLWARSENGIDPINCGCYPTGTAYMSQSVSLYDASGNLIYSKSRNVNMTTTQTAVFSYNLASYEGQTVTLKIRTSASAFMQTAPSWSTLYIDDIRFSPTVIGGGGTYGW